MPFSTLEYAAPGADLAAAPVAGSSRTNRMSALAVGLIIVLAVCDLFAKGMALGVLYPMALIVLTRVRGASHLRWATVLLIALTFAGHFFKSWWFDVDPLDFRLVNRSLVALVLVLLNVLLQCRVIGAWRVTETEISEQFRRDEDEIDETLAICLGILSMGAIATADMLAPANYNLSILYLAPLFLCVWIRNRTLLWCTAALALILTYVDSLVGPGPTGNATMTLVLANRSLTALSIALTALLLYFRNERPPVDSLTAQMSAAWKEAGKTAG